jgi:quercetin dioxygenase-like cupin family protein
MEPFRYIKDVEKKEIFKGVIGQYLGSGEKMNVMHWNFDDNVILPSHKHESEQFGYVIKGAFRATIGDKTQLIEAGDSYFIPSNTQHSFTSVGETEAIDVFSPIREID